MKMQTVSRWVNEKIDQDHRFAASISEITSPWTWITGSLVYLGIISGYPEWGILAVTFFGVIPFLSLLFLLRRGYVSDRRVSHRQERVIAISVLAVPILCGATALVHWNAPPVILSASIAGTTLLGIQSVVTLLLKWKISFHSSVGAMCSMFLITGHHTSTIFSLLLLSSAAIGGWSRYRLKAHTPSQVFAGGVAGTLVGALFGSAFMP